VINASNAANLKAPVYSLVIPIFNEEAVLPLLVHRIKALPRGRR
jgi:dolichol-phosphate mannosyltransferase